MIYSNQGQTLENVIAQLKQEKKLKGVQDVKKIISKTFGHDQAISLRRISK